MKDVTFFEAVKAAMIGEEISYHNSGIVLIWDEKSHSLIYKDSHEKFRSYSMKDFFDEEKSWWIIEVEHNILWAAEMLNQGKKVRRASWTTEPYFIEKLGDSVRCRDGHLADMATEDLLAKDWRLFN